MAGAKSIYVGKDAVRRAEELAVLWRKRTGDLVDRCDVTREALRQLYDREFGTANDEPADVAAGLGENN